MAAAAANNGSGREKQWQRPPTSLQRTGGASPKFLAFGNANEKNEFFSLHFAHLFVTLPSKMANLLHLGKKRNKFLCFALDFS
ncbi:MAG: hypothetical protein IJ059_00655 [Prevotella sp.]|nr:hypothetical protein [Prevotella sp.]